MNEAQKKIMISVAIGLVITFLFPPHAFFLPNGNAIKMGYAFIANIPYGYSMHMLVLLAEWLGIVVLGGIFYFIAKSDSTETGAASEQWHNQKQNTQREYTSTPPESKHSKGSTPVYSWRRYFARMIDYNISTILIIIIFVLWKETGHQLPKQLFDMLANPETGSLVHSMFWGLFSCLLWVVVESIILSEFGTTPGKELFRLRLVSENKKPNYWGRSVAVCAAGVGFGIPIVSGLAALNAAARLKMKGKTDWDRWTGFSVEGEPLSISRIVALTILMLVIFGLGIDLQTTGVIAKRIAPSQEQSQQVQVEQNTQQDTTSSTNGANDIAQRANDLYNQGRYEEALPLVLQLAEQNNVSWQLLSGTMFENGLGVKQDYSQAVYWYKKAAEQGNVDGQFHLGYLYAKGLGVAQDNNQAFYWYKKAAEQGDANAQTGLGLMYVNGYGVAQDYNQAVYWFRKAAEQGYAVGQNNLGYMYDNGYGVTKDYNQAVFWFHKAAEQGYAVGQNSLGDMYNNGYGVTKDYNQAVFWYKKAAEQGDADAIAALEKVLGKEKNEIPHQVQSQPAQAHQFTPSSTGKNETLYQVQRQPAQTQETKPSSVKKIKMANKNRGDLRNCLSLGSNEAIAQCVGKN